MKEESKSFNQKATVEYDVDVSVKVVQNNSCNHQLVIKVQDYEISIYISDETYLHLKEDLDNNRQ